MNIPNRTATRTDAIARAHAHFDDGDFIDALRRRVAIPSTSQEPERAEALRAYLRDEMEPALTPLGFKCRIFENPPRATARRSWWPSGSKTRHSSLC